MNNPRFLNQIILEGNIVKDTDDKGWGIMFREGYCSDDVILWCEISKFEGANK